MARKYGRLMVTIWKDPEYQSLSLADQGLFAGLLAYPTTSWCGVIDYIPARLVKLSTDLTPQTLAEGVNRLAVAGLLCLDDETKELLIRRFVHYDGVLNVKNVGKAMVAAMERVESEGLRAVMVDELARIWLVAPELQGWLGVAEMNLDLMAEVEDAAREICSGTAC